MDRKLPKPPSHGDDRFKKSMAKIFKERKDMSKKLKTEAVTLEKKIEDCIKILTPLSISIDEIANEMKKCYQENKNDIDTNFIDLDNANPKKRKKKEDPEEVTIKLKKKKRNIIQSSYRSGNKNIGIVKKSMGKLVDSLKEEQTRMRESMARFIDESLEHINKVSLDSGNLHHQKANQNDGNSMMSGTVDQRSGRSIYGDRGTKYIIMRSDPNDGQPPYLKSTLFSLLQVSDYNNMGNSVQQNVPPPPSGIQGQQQQQQRTTVSIGNKNMANILKMNKKK